MAASWSSKALRCGTAKDTEALTGPVYLVRIYSGPEQALLLPALFMLCFLLVYAQLL